MFRASWRRPTTAVVAVVVVVLTVTLGGCGVTTAAVKLHGGVGRSASARTAGRRTVLASADGLPADCIPKPTPSPYYQLGLVGTVTNGTITTPTVSVDDVDAKICGIVQVQPGTGGCAADTTITVPADGQAFAPLKATVAVVPGQPISVPFTVVPHPLTASLGCGSSADGLVFSVSATVSGSTGLFGVACTIGPIALSIQGAAGQPGFNPPTTSLSDVTGRFTADFGIPAVSPDATCPSSVAANLDPIAQLPTTPDAAHLVLPIVTSIYQPG